MAKGFLRQSERDAIFRDAGEHDYHFWKGHPHAHEYEVEPAHDWLGHHPEGDPVEDEQPPAHKHEAAVGQARYILLPHWDPQGCVDIMHDHHAEMSGHTAGLSFFAAPQIGPEVMDQAQHGGFTLHDHVGDAPTGGYMVSLAKDSEEKRPINQLTPEHISNFAGRHARELTDPHAYLGGWLDGGNFYLDISHHRPNLNRATTDAVRANQLGIYDLNHGKTINTDDAGWMTGNPGIVGAWKLSATAETPSDSSSNSLPRHPSEQNPGLPSRSQAKPLPLHDWSLHSLGDEEDWYDQPEYHQAAAPHVFQPYDAGPSEPQQPSFDPKALQDTGTQLGTHGAQVWRNPANNENWLIKHAPKPAPFLADLDVAANHIAAQSGVDTPPTFKTDMGHGPASAQLMYHDATNAFHENGGKGVNPDKLSDDDMLTIQKHHALDWMLSNHDSHGGQFIRTPEGKLIGIDKGQAFKHFAQDRLHWNFHPNGKFYDEAEPVYNTMYRNMAIGGKQLMDPRQGELAKYIQGLQSIPDEEYANTLRPYAEGAAKAGMLAKHFGDYDQFAKPRVKPNDVEGFLKAAIERKNNLSNDFGDLYDRAMAHRMTGEKLASAPHPDLLQPMEQEMGTHGAKLYADGKGDQWLIKKPPQGMEFMAPLAHATAALQHRVGLEGPETHLMNWTDGSPTAAVKIIPGAEQAFDQPPSLKTLSNKDLLTLQKHQAIDWLISNHDSHVGNFLRTQEGNLVGIDKDQAGKYYGRDRLDYDFHPNYYAREPVYNNLWREFSAGRGGDMHNPSARHSELGRFIQDLQGIPDHSLKAMFRPYAEQAAAAGLLANPSDKKDPRHRGEGAPPPREGEEAYIDPSRKLGKATITPNDPEEFLEAMAKRKNNLLTDLGSLYDRAAAKRTMTLRTKNPAQIDPHGEGKHEALPEPEGTPTIEPERRRRRDMEDAMFVKRPRTTPRRRRPLAPTSQGW